MPLHPQIEAFLAMQAAAGTPPLQEQTIEMARAGYVALAEAVGPGPDLFAVRDENIPGPDGNSIPLRIYRPSDENNLAVLLYIHGGGWVIGDLDTHDEVCRALAHDAGVIVVAVHYRLAPEHPFPAAVHDCYAALEWISANAQTIGADAQRIAVGGDSAGGNLAAVISQIARDREGPEIQLQLLIYPATDMTQAHASIETNGEGMVLTQLGMQWFRGHYLPDSLEWTNPMASPLHAQDLSKLPRALVITAEYDPLRDEGEDYAGRLKSAGTEVEVKRYDGMVHMFYQLSALVDAGQEAIDQSVGALKRALR